MNPVVFGLLVVLGAFLVFGVGAFLLIFACALRDAWVARRRRGERGWP